MKKYVFFILYILSNSAFGATFGDGVRAYQQGDFKKSEAVFKQAISTTKNLNTRAEIYKYLGMSQYSLKAKDLAAQSFLQARKLKPQIAISADEVLDPSVIDFFNQSSPNQNTAAKNAPGSKPQPKGKAQPTTLFIESNVKNASVSIGGILVGQTQSILDVDSGVVLIEVSAPSYQKKLVRANIKKNLANHLVLNLGKPAAKPLAKAAPKVIPTAQTKSTVVAKKPAQDDLFKEASDPLPSTPAPQQGPMLAQSLPPPPQMLPQPPGYPQQQAMPYQLPQVIYQQPVYSAPPPVYIQPYPQQQLYPQQPYPQQPMYSPPYDPNAGSSVPPLPSGPSQPLYNNSPNEQKNRDDQPTKKRRSPGSPFISILPFGAGQFQNGSYIKGSVFLLSEITAIYFWKVNFDAADAATKQLNTDSADFDTQIAAAPDAPSKTYYQNQKDSRQSELSGYIQTSNNNAMISLATFGGLYVVGVVDAFIFTPEKTPLPKKKKSRRSGFSLDLKHFNKKDFYAVDMSLDLREQNAVGFKLGSTTKGELMLGIAVDL